MISIPRHLAACDLLRAPVRLIEVMPELRVFNLSGNKITALEAPSVSIKSKIQVLCVPLSTCKRIGIIVVASNNAYVLFN